MNADHSIRILSQLTTREIFHLLRECEPTVKHHLKVMASVQGVSMGRYVNEVLAAHFNGLRKG